MDTSSELTVKVNNAVTGDKIEQIHLFEIKSDKLLKI